MLPMIYSDPGLARDVLLYSASEQPLKGGQIPYAMSSLCRPNEALAHADDMDLWLLWSAASVYMAVHLAFACHGHNGTAAPFYTADFRSCRLQ